MEGYVVGLLKYKDVVADIHKLGFDEGAGPV